MLRTFHKYQKSVVLVFTAIIICGAMLFFGLTPYDNYSQSYALKINGEEISTEKYYRVRENLEGSYRQQFGDFWDKLLELRNTSIAQEAQEEIIKATLLSQFAKKIDLAVSPATVDMTIREQFGANLTPEYYAAFLARSNMSSEQFKSLLAADLLPMEVQNLYKSLVIAAEPEVKNKIIKDESEYSFSAAEINPEKFTEQVAKPEVSVLEEYFNSNAVNYLISPKVSYSYAILKPENIINSIQIPAEDIELYYSDHLSRFTEAEQVKARKIELTFKPEEIEKIDEYKTLADKIITDAKAGKKFEDLVKTHTKIEADKKNGGDLGWVKKGSRGASFDQVIFTSPVPGELYTVTGDTSVQIILVEDHKAETIKKLEDVKTEIEGLLKLQEGPAYAKLKGQDLHDAWSKDSSKTIQDLALANNLKVEELKTYEKGADPAPELRGVTDYALTANAESKLLFEVGDNSVLIQVKEVLPETQPAFKDVAEKVFQDYQKAESIKLTRTKADELLQKSSAEGADFNALIKAYGAEPKNTENQKMSSRADLLKNPDIHKAVFAAKVPTLLSKVFEEGGKFYVIKITNIKPPEEKIITEKLDSYKERTKNEQVSLALNALIRKLKAQAKIEISPTLTES